jgi:hypothetical protein
MKTKTHFAFRIEYLGRHRQQHRRALRWRGRLRDSRSNLPGSPPALAKGADHPAAEHPGGACYRVTPPASLRYSSRILLRAMLLGGAGPVGQPSPDTITTAVRLAPRQPLFVAGGGAVVVSGIHSSLGVARP